MAVRRPSENYRKKQSNVVAEETMDFIRSYWTKAFTIIADNGMGFAKQAFIKEQQKIDIYFPHP